MKVFFSKRWLFFLLPMIFMAKAYAENGGLSIAGIKKQINSYNVVWTEQSESSAGSMPLSGNKGMGLNAWVQDGDIFLYLASNESYDENSDLLKLGCVRLHLSPNPFATGCKFKQELDIYSSQIIITGQLKNGMKGRIRLWYDVRRPVLYAQAESSVPTILTASFATWRDRNDSVGLGNYDFGGNSLVRADIVNPNKNSIVWYHQNDNSQLIVNQLIRKQNFQPFSSTINDFTRNLIFGGMISGKGLVAAGSETVQWQKWSGRAWHLKSQKAASAHNLIIVPLVKQETDVEKWKEEVSLLSHQATVQISDAQKEREQWWADFWQRSYIFINPQAGVGDTAWQIGRNYQLFRYMWACNRGGKLPLKFNGGIFTMDPPDPGLIQHYTSHYKINAKVTPDYRRWGNLFMGQNQRLIGWPGLASGDFDLVSPSLKFYTDRLPVAEARSKLYWNHGGAAFAEPLDLSGLPVNRLSSSNGPMSPAHLKYHLSMQVEFAFMALQLVKYSGEDLSSYLPFIESVARFYDEHYRMENLKRTGREYDENGKLVLFPLNSLELYSEATDPVEVVAGLKRITEEILSFPPSKVPLEARNWFEAFAKHIPDINFETRNGKTVIKPAKIYGREYNTTDFPEMYTLWPYGLFHAGKSEGLAEANNTWENLPSNRQSALEFWSWMCTPIYAAMMGRREDARRLIIEKLSNKNANLKFPAFFGPGHDWLPDHNWGGSGMAGLQTMLLFNDQSDIFLFPAWPKEWDVTFKLHASEKTVVEGRYENGKIVALQVSPQQREQDIKVLIKQ
ncbi:MAG: DUF5703 domain-containing protein [Bacteroidota bacterium]|nr:DUF5703 domain-containing protein [Bacteroidota bacterium]